MAYQGSNYGNNKDDNYSEYIVLQMLNLKVGSKEDCIRACKAVKSRSLNEAVDWLMQHPNGGGSDHNTSNNNNYGHHKNNNNNNNNNNNQYNQQNNNNNYGNKYNQNNYGQNKAKYEPKTDYNEAWVIQLTELGLGTRSQCIEACRANPNNFDGAMDYLEKLQSKQENKQKKNNNNNNKNGGGHYGGYGGWNNNNNNYQNSTRYKINAIKDKYPELTEDRIKDLLSRHNDDLQNTLKFIELKTKQQQERERQVALQRQREQEQKQEVTEEELANLFASLLSLAVVEEAGFVTASDENRIEIIKRLTKVEPKGQTALRDAVIIGIGHMLKVKHILIKLGALKHRFVHIVLTDGEDTKSEESQDALKGFFLRLGHELGDICKTFFIGVGLNYKERSQLDQISRLGGDSCELFNCQDVEISDVFNRISIGLGIRRQIIAMEHQGAIYAAKKDQLAIQLKENKFLVLFTLDMSGSMSGGRWRKVVAAVAGFMTGLKSHDIVGCILFNEKAVIITDQ